MEKSLEELVKEYKEKEKKSKTLKFKFKTFEKSLKRHLNH